MKNKCIVIFIVSLCVTFTLKAQFRHEFAISFGGGISTLNYKPEFGDKKFFDQSSAGAVAGLDYSYFFSKRTGLRTGLEFVLYNSQMTFDRFDFSSTEWITNYEEEQTATYVNIPLMFQYQTNGLHRFYASAGAKVGIYTNTKYHTDGVARFNGVDYSLPNREKTTKVDLKLAYMLSAEAGVKWRLSNRFVFYTGLYADYALNNVVKHINEPFIDYQSTDLRVNSTLVSQYETGKNVVDKASPLAVGIKIRLAFGAVHEDRGREDELTSIDFDRKLLEEVEKQQEEQEKWEARLIFEKEKQDVFTPISNFPLSVTDLTDEQKAELDRKIDFLKLYPNLKVVCVGHTCNQGNNVVNENVGMKRAVTARRYMVEKGINRNRINTVSKGKNEPLVPNDTEENRLINRRVEFIVIEFY